MAETPTGSSPGTTAVVASPTAVLAPSGDLDLLTAPALSDRLDALTDGPCPDVVLDLRAVSFIDCAGISVLCRARNRVRARYGRLRLVTDSARFLRMLRQVRLDGAFDILPGLPSAEDGRTLVSGAAPGL
ncbi:STAS domain-containing protein [Streptomyces sp. NPDC057386]|uniref:STAS domain-containing protein n=1 Tax=unclassified Streptomyces TaxID=2593676 RepID=UPI00363B1C12